MKIAIVVQRYGADINGGAELHARYIAERLSQRVDIEVLTTCASDYITWRNALPAGVESVNGVTVRRFPVVRERDPAEFGRISDRVFNALHSIRDELTWLDSEGPTSPELIAHIQAHAAAFDFFIFFSCRYYHAYHGVRAVSAKAMLVPTAERDGALGLAIFGPIFRGVRALMYNSFEERALIQTVSRNHDVPGVVVGVGSEIPGESSAARFRQKFKLTDRFAIYIGRIDENKGCHELFDFFQRYTRLAANPLHLVLIGNPIIPIPDHPKIHHLGFVSDQDKFDALAAASLLIMPSYFESLSMVAIEAWALGKPVLANGRCDVLKGQSIRSNAGLYYENFIEFVETLRAIDTYPTLAAALGRNGRAFFEQNYTWPIIEGKYLDMIERLANEPPATTIESMPWWFQRRREDLPPAEHVVAMLPTGPALDGTAPAAEAAVAAPVAAGMRHDRQATVESSRDARETRSLQPRPRPSIDGRQPRDSDVRRRSGRRPPRRPGGR
jgi:glycosyltransferase involved in cell wall biosynthesis